MESFRLSIERNFLRKSIDVEKEFQTSLLKRLTELFETIEPTTKYNEVQTIKIKMIVCSMEREKSKKRQNRLEKKLIELR